MCVQMPKISDARARQARSSPRSSARPSDLPDPGPDASFFRHTVLSMRNAVIAIRRDGSVILINDEAYRVFSMTPAPDDVGRPFSDVFRHRPEAVRALANAFDLTTLPNRAELRLKDLNRVVGYTLSQVRNDEGQLIGAVMFFKDLTLVEQVEERERLRDRLASLGEMAAGIAHELKNPLAGIQVMAGLLRRQVPDSPDAQALLADILAEAKLANAIVVEMLEFVRPIRLQVERTDLSDVLHQAATLAGSNAAPGQTAVRLHVAPGLPAIEGDHHQLCQVFTNLLTNAFEALEGRGQVDITAVFEAIQRDRALAGDVSDPTPSVIVEVADNGPGIPPDLTDRLFDPFFSTKPQGMGLRLAIVRKIVDAHEGRIDLTSEPGHGTRFRVTLPVSSGQGWFNQERKARD